MTLAPLLAAPIAVQAHVAIAVAAFLVGGARIAAPWPERADRALGWGFLALLAATAASAFLLTPPAGTPRLLGLSLGHGFRLATAAGLVAAVAAARRGERLLWCNLVTGLFAGVLLVCALFELMPGRVLNSVLAGGG